jgi:HD-GYP domain-containing protein (c-di-GMP phosphodiesterase class II)
MKIFKGTSMFIPVEKSMNKNKNNGQQTDQNGFYQKKFVVMQELGNLVTLADNHYAITNLIMDIVEHHLGADKCSLMMCNDRDELYIVAARGFEEHFVNKYRIKIGTGTIGAAAGKRLPVFVKDGRKDEKRGDLKEHAHFAGSIISCPIASRSRLLGVLNVFAKADGMPLGEEDFELVQVIANHAAIALENLFLVNQLKIKASELEMTNRKLIDTDVTKTEFLTCLSHELRTPLNAIKGSIYHLENANKLEIDERREFYSIIARETDKLLVFVESQLDFLISGDITRSLNNSLLDLAEICGEISSSRFISQLTRKKQFGLRFDIEEGSPCICCDKTKLTQLFDHMIEGLSFFLNRNDILLVTVSDGEFIQVKFQIPVKLPEASIPELFNTTCIHRKDEEDQKIKFGLARKIIELYHWSVTARNSENNFIISIAIPKNRKQKIEAALSPSANLLLEILSESLGIDICSLMLNDELTGELTIKSALGLDDDIVRRTRIRVGDKISGWVALEGNPLLIENIENDPRFGKISSNQYNTKSLISIPLKVSGKVIGVLNLNNKKSGEAFTEQDLHLATVIVERFAHVLEKLFGNDVRERDIKQLLTSLSGLLDAHKKYHKKQTLFPDLVVQIMNRLEVAEQEKQLALYVSTIYDLGLMLLHPDILSKKRLQSAEKNALRIHPYNSLDLLHNFEFSEEVKKAILHHHERFDGSGYPDGLQGEQIPVISRVIAVIDGFCAMISKRPYRNQLSVPKALQEIKKGSGSLYDPMVVDALEDAIRNNMFIAEAEMQG